MSRYDDGSASSAESKIVAVEIMSAELSSDSGSPPNVRCTLEHRPDVAGKTSSVVSTSLCRQSWNPVWREVLNLLVFSPSGAVVDLTLWDDSAGEEPCCLGEAVLSVDDLLSHTPHKPLQIRSIPIHQGLEEDRVVGTVLLRPVLSSSAPSHHSRPRRSTPPFTSATRPAPPSTPRPAAETPRGRVGEAAGAASSTTVNLQGEAMQKVELCLSLFGLTDLVKPSPFSPQR
jgi:hypothetical protein